jgi:hypothetical protein
MADLSNISVNGICVEEWLNETENKLKHVEIEKIQKIESNKHYPYKPPLHKQQSKSGPFKRATKLTDQQIRKEYGIMKKPFNNLNENIVWVIVNHGPISTEEILTKLGRTDRNSVSAAVSYVWSKLGINQDVLYREKKGRAYFYNVAIPYAGISDETIVEMYRVDKRKKVIIPEFETKKDESPEHFNCLREPIPSTENNDLVQKIGKIIGQTLGIEIKVSGKIEFVIRVENGMDNEK